ncbi:MAG: choice-of-anchor Q domain-containing protein [Methanosarcinaceae archaeon]
MMTKKSIYILLVMILCELFFLSSLLSARSFFLAVHGSDDAGGSETAPWVTLNRAQETILPGDTLYIRGGKYTSQPTVIWTRSGTSERPIVIQAYPGENPVFIREDDYVGHLFQIQPADWLIIKGLEVTGYRCAIWMGYTTAGLNYAEHNIICHNYFHDLKEHLIYLSWGVRDIQIYNNRFENPGNDLGTNGYCIHGWHGPGVVGARIFNNVLVGGYGGIVFADGARDIEIYNNVLYDNFIGLRFDFSGGGEGSEGFVRNVTIKNNIIYSTSANLWSLMVAPENSAEIIIDYNIWYRPGGNALINWSGKMYSVYQYQNNTSNGEHSSFADPLFVDVSQLNFHLQPNSIAIDNGVPYQNLDIDKDRTSRPQGDGYDIGAYEYIQPNEVVADTTAPAIPKRVRIP